MADRLVAFARRKAEEAFTCFEQGTWADGIPRAKAALDLLARAKCTDEELAARLCTRICNGLGSAGRFGEALEFFCEHSLEVANDNVKDQLLQSWLSLTNTPAKGDLVQLPTKSLSTAEGYERRLIGIVVGLIDSTNSDGALPGTQSRWSVKLQSSAAVGERDLPSIINAAETQETCKDDEQVELLEVDAVDLTLLTLKLTKEQREQWLTLLERCPSLFGERIKPENEARWQKLFGGCAVRNAGAISTGTVAGASDIGLPLEQSFTATLYGILNDWLRARCKSTGSKAGVEAQKTLVVDILGCRPALELADPFAQVSAVFRSCQQLDWLETVTVRMCGPEVNCAAWQTSGQLSENLHLELEVRPGLYHDAFCEGGADIVVAMNAGIGVPQYKHMWRPTLDFLSKQTKTALFAVTSYSPGEILREERILRRLWADECKLHTPKELAQLLRQVSGLPPWTLSDDIVLPGNPAVIKRGDVVEPWRMPKPCKCASISETVTALSSALNSPGLEAALAGPWTFRILRANLLAYVGPNPTPGRSRNYGKLLLWVGGR